VLSLYVIYQGKVTLNDQAPECWSKRLIRLWARQRLESGVTVRVLDETRRVIFEETCA
jgi:hypothetical protein